MINIKVPTHWNIGRKKEFIALNWYRNAHFQVLSKVKRDFTASLSELKGNTLKTPISITYIFHPSRKGQDAMNSISIIDKFFQDSLVHYGVIPDDTYDDVTLITCIVGEKDKEGYVEIIAESIR